MKSSTMLAVGGLLVVPAFLFGMFISNTVLPGIWEATSPSYYEYYLKDNNTIRSYNMTEEHKMLVYFEDSITEEAEYLLRDGLMELDEILTNDIIEVVEEVPINNNYITVSVKKYIDDDVVGRCYTTELPKRIELKQSLIAYKWASDNISCFKKVFQHELGHALGLIDLYEDKYIETSVMYYLYTANKGKCAHTYTPLDIENLQRLY